MRFITNVPADEFIALLKAHGLPGRQLVGRHQGVLVSGHAGRRTSARGSRAGCTPSTSCTPATTPTAIARAVARSSRTAATRRRTSTTSPTPARRSSTCWRGVELYTQKRFYETTPRERRGPHDRTTHFDDRRRREIGPGQSAASSSRKPGINHNGDAGAGRRSWSTPPPKPAPTPSSSRRIFPNTRCCAAAPRRRTSASRCSTC